MNKLVLPLLILVLVAGGLTWLWMDSGATDIDLTDPHSGTTGLPEDLTAGGKPRGWQDPERLDPRTGDPRFGDPRIGEGRIAAEAEVVVYGRCLDAANSLPLSGCRVDVAATSQRFARRRTESTPNDLAATELAPNAITGANGDFRIALSVPAGHVIRVTTWMDGRANMRGFLQATSNTVDAGDILIPYGSRFEAEVVDEQGAPQPDIALRLYRTITGSNPPIAAMNWINIASDSGGFLESAALLASGVWRVTATQNIRVIEPRGTFEIPEQGGVYRTKIVVRPPDPKAMISGTILSEKGDPIRNIAVHARDGSRWPIGYGTSDRNGAFRVRCRTTPGEPVRLSVPRAVGFETLETTEKYAWGRTGVRLTLRRAGNLTIRVVAADTGAPVERFRISWARANDVGSGYQGSRGKLQDHPDGKVTIPGVPSGAIRVVAIPDGRDLAPNDPLELQNGSGAAELRIELEPRLDLAVVVKTRNGTPIQGSKLQLVRAFGDKPVSLDAYTVDHVQLPQFADSKNHELLLDQTTTDRSGRATLRWSASTAALGIRVLGPGHVPTIHQPVVITAESKALEIVVTSGGRVSGLLRPLEVLSSLRPEVKDSRSRSQAPTLIFTFLGQGGPRGAHRSKSVTVDDRGRFAVEGLHPGNWDVAFRVWRFGGGRRSNIVHKKFDSIEIQEGQDQQLDLDIDDLRPATLSGQVIVNGTPHARGSIHLIRVTATKGQSQTASDTILATDDRGDFEAQNIQAGKYRVGVDVPTKGSTRTTRLMSQDTTEVAAGTKTQRFFRIESGVLRVLLRNRAGQPVPNRYVAVTHQATQTTTGAETDATGLAEINPIATGTFTIGVYKPVQTSRGKRRAPRKGSLHVIGEVTVTAGRMANTVAVTLPKGYEIDDGAEQGRPIR